MSHFLDRLLVMPNEDIRFSDVRLVAFDLDDTLAPSKSPLPPQMGQALRSLLQVLPVCVISGGRYEQFEHQLLPGLAGAEDLFDRLHLMPTCGTRYLRFNDGAWSFVYRHDLTQEEKDAAIDALKEESKRLGLWETETWGPIIEDRESQITFSALGQEAPLDNKRAWDPDGSKKRALVGAVAPRLPGLEVRGGGSTSVDITARGVDKAYGMTRLVEQTGIPKESMLFIGDRLDEGGNDYPVLAGGWPTQAVDSWEETVQVIERIVSQTALV